MKLVDILARELTAWPADCDYVTQSKLHAEIHNTPNGRISESRKFLPGIFLNERHEEDGYPLVTRAEWQAAVDALNADKCEHSYANNIGCPECGELNAPKVVEWDGVGLPPVGLDVEVMQDGLPSVAFDWEACKILAINIGSDEKPQVITRDFRGDAAIYYPGIDSVYFRPIRIAEQVAAEEREAEDNEVMSRYMSLSDCEKGMLGHSPERVIIGLMRLMGYRKEPKPCGS